MGFLCGLCGQVSVFRAGSALLSIARMEVMAEHARRHRLSARRALTSLVAGCLPASAVREELHAVIISISPSKSSPPSSRSRAGGGGWRMSAFLTPILLLSVGIAVVTVIGDWLIKNARHQGRTPPTP